MAFHKAHGDLRKMAGRGKARARFTPATWARFTPATWARWLKEHNERQALRPMRLHPEVQ